MLPCIESLSLSKDAVDARCGRDSLINNLLQSLDGILAAKNGAIANVVSSLSRELLLIEREDIAVKASVSRLRQCHMKLLT